METGMFEWTPEKAKAMVEIINNFPNPTSQIF